MIRSNTTSILLIAAVIAILAAVASSPVPLVHGKYGQEARKAVIPIACDEDSSEVGLIP
jgi:hypothetical protein